jgi:hypothetical protein
MKIGLSKVQREINDALPEKWLPQKIIASLSREASSKQIQYRLQAC